MADPVDIQSFTTLDQVRSHIDTLDHELIRLFNQRMAIALQLYQAQQTTQPAAHARKSSIIASAQHTSLLDAVQKINDSVTGPCTNTAIQAIYTEIDRAGELLQKRTVVALACETGDVLHDIAQQYYSSINNKNVDIVCLSDTATAASSSPLHATWCSVETGTAEYGIVPLYLNDNDINTLNSNDTISMLSSPQNHIDIYTELLYTAEYYILGHTGQQITTLYAQSHTLAVCQQYINTYLPNVDIIVDNSLRSSCIYVQHSKNSAVLGGLLAAKLYNLHTINLTDRVNAPIAAERCRSIILAARSGPPTGADKTFITFAVHDRSGDLHDALATFKANGISLTRIESHASRDRVKIWDYGFFAEFAGHQNDPHVRDALVQLEQQSRFVKVLGSCPTVNLDSADKQQNEVKQ